MDKQEANKLLEQELQSYSQLSYAQLLERMDESVVYEVKGASGVAYQVEIRVLWDDIRKKEDVRVLGSIDDGNFLSLTTYIPVTQSILVSKQDF